MKCIGCGCTDDNACCEGMRDGVPITCHWVAPEVCSRCRTIAEISYAHATNRPWLFENLEAQSERRIV